MNQLDMLDSRTAVVLHQSALQREHLESVTKRVAPVVLEFCDRYCGMTFHAEQLTRFVTERFEKLAPETPMRVFRSLGRPGGEIVYQLVSRSKSLYRVLP